ncbi:MAG: response regulator [Deltaproteobacteria bacterium]|nr:response regulator [Deltaproteobacteria bacterium]
MGTLNRTSKPWRARSKSANSHLARDVQQSRAMRTISRVPVLLVEDVELEAKLMMRTLADAGYANVTHSPDLTKALEQMTTTKPRIVITDYELDKSRGSDLVKKIRAQAGDDYVFIVMVTGHTNVAIVRDAFEAGIDDFVAKPYRPEELVGRMRAGERILQLETMLRARSRELEMALRRIDVAAAQRALAKAAEVRIGGPAEGGSAMDAVLATESWASIDKLLAKSISDFFQLDFACTSVGSPGDDAYVAQISLNEPTRQLEIDLSVVTDLASMKAFAMHLLGADDDLEGAQALVLEVANILMGAMKTAFVTHGFNFVGGIPAQTSYQLCRAGFDASQVRTRLAVAHGDSKAEFWVRLKEKTNKKLRGKSLREGLVISEDVRDDKGMLLIRGGSRLSQTAAERLAKLVPNMEIAVSDPAAA